MNAKRLAERIKKAGLPVHGSAEGDTEVDGTVDITDYVSVQVPTDDGPPLVVLYCRNGNFMFYNERRSFSALVADINDAMRLTQRKSND